MGGMGSCEGAAGKGRPCAFKEHFQPFVSMEPELDGMEGPSSAPLST